MAATTKPNTTPKSKPMPNGQSVHAGKPQREPNWNARRVAIVKAMRELKATSPTAGRTAAEIAAKAAKKGAPELADRVDLVKVVLDVYRTAELVHNGFAASVRLEGERELRYYLTKKGQTTTFPAKAKAEKAAA